MASQAYNILMQIYDGTDWHILRPMTLSDNIDTDGQDNQFVTVGDLSQIATYLYTFNAANKLLQLNGNGEIPIGLIPGGLSYLPLAGGTMTGNINLNNKNITNVSKIEFGTGGGFIEVDGPNSMKTGEIYAYGGLTSTGHVTAGSGLYGQSLVMTNVLSANASNGLVMHPSRGISTDGLNVNTIGPRTGSIVEIDTTTINTEATTMAFTATGGGTITGLKDAVGDTDAVTWAQAKSIAADGLKPMPPVRLASTGNVNPTGVQNIDGITTLNGDRVLLKNQTAAASRGVYIVNTGGAWSRVDAQSQKGFYGQVLLGTVNRGTWWYADTNTSWELHSQPDEYGVIVNGGLVRTGMNFGIAATGVTNAMLAGEITATNLASMTADEGWSWTQLPNIPQGGLTTPIENHLNNLYSAITNLRGTNTYNTPTPQTINGAYSAINTKNKNTLSNLAASSTGRVAGDLHFQWS